MQAGRVNSSFRQKIFIRKGEMQFNFLTSALCITVDFCAYVFLNFFWKARFFFIPLLVSGCCSFLSGFSQPGIFNVN